MRGVDCLSLRLKERRIRIFGRILILSGKMQLIGASLFLFFGLCYGLHLISRSENHGMPISHSTYSAATQAAAQEPTPAALSPEADLVIHIAGAVANPGLIRLPVNARIADAIDAAGGLAEDADCSAVNLASPLLDGIKLYIPRLGESTPLIIETPASHSSSPAGKININNAGIEELTKLAGIGTSTAQKIVAYREQNGKFLKKEDLMKVSGIGAAKYKTVEEQICI